MKVKVWIRIAAVTLVLALAAGLTACGGASYISLTEMTDVGDYTALFTGIRQVDLRYADEAGERTYAMTREESMEELFSLLEKVEIEKEPLSRDLSEDRAWGLRLMLIPFGAGSGVSLCFSPDCTEYFVLDDVKPSYSHKVRDPETVRAVLDLLAQCGTLETGDVSALSQDEKIALSQPELDLGGESQSLSVTWRNLGDTERSTGQYFYVYTLSEDGTLTQVEPSEEGFWQDIGYVLEPGKDRVVTYDLTGYTFEENTRYRIYLGGDSQSDYAVEFTTGTYERLIPQT